jgi:hypothetical protein
LTALAGYFVLNGNNHPLRFLFLHSQTSTKRLLFLQRLLVASGVFSLISSAYSQLPSSSAQSHFLFDDYVAGPNSGHGLSTDFFVEGNSDWSDVHSISDGVLAEIKTRVSAESQFGTNSRSFSLTAIASAESQFFSETNQGSARGSVGVQRTLSMFFGQPVLWTINGSIGVSGSESGDIGGGSGSAFGLISSNDGINKSDSINISTPPEFGDSRDVSGKGISSSLGVILTVAAAANSSYSGSKSDGGAAGIANGEMDGFWDPDVVDPGSLNGKVIFTNFLGNLLGNCMVIAKYPPLVTYTGKTGTLDNVQSVIFNPPATFLTPFAGLPNATCRVIYKIGVTQDFDFSVSYRMVANGPLVRFAEAGQTTAKIVYPANWTNTCLFLTNITFQPPPETFLPIGTNQGLANWSSANGSSGSCPFDIIIKSNLSGNPGAYQMLQAEFPNDSDADGMADWQELIAGTETLDATSVLKLSAQLVTTTNVIVAWPTVVGIRYQLESGVLDGSPFVPVGGVITGADGLETTNVNVPLSIGATNRFYRIRVVTD